MVFYHFTHSLSRFWWAELSGKCSEVKIGLVCSVMNFQSIEWTQLRVPLRLEGSCLLRTVLRSTRYGFYHLPRRLHFLWERAAYWQHVRDTQSSFVVITHISSLHSSPLWAYFFVLSFNSKEIDAKRRPTKPTSSQSEGWLCSNM